MMLRNAVLQLSECCEGVTYPEIMQDLSHLLAMYYRVAKSSNQKSCVDRSAFSKGKWKHDVTVCLTWDEAAKVYNWISKIICEGISQKKNDIPELGRFVSSLSSITTLFREVKLFPQSESGSCLNIQPYKEALNILLDQLRNLMLLFKSGCSDAQSSYSTIFESFNKISHMVGNLVLGNLNQIDADVLTPLAEQLMRELQSRRTVLDPLQSVTIYATLSHLTYLHPVWDKLQESADVSNEASCQIHTTDILAPSSALYHSVLDALVDGLKRCDPYMLRTASQGSDEDRSTVIRQVVLSCLNGLAQLLLRRTSRSNTTNLTTVVRVLWTHVLTFGCQYGTNRRLNQAVVGHDGAASSSMSSGQSSPSSSLPTTSDEEGALKRSSGQCSKDRHQPNSRSYRNSSSCILASALVASGPLCSSSSEDERNTCGAWFGTTRSIACGLLAGSPGGTIPRTSHRQHLDASGFRGPHSRSHTSGFTNQLKPYALSVFCLKRLLEGCRSSSALDLWPTLMCGDGWAGMIPLSSTIRTVSNQSSSLYSETDRPNVALTPDLLTLVYKTSDMRIRKMLVEVLISLLAAVGKRFVIAEDLTPHSASFVPYSVRLAVELRHLHRRLMLALYGEKSVVLRGLLLKALTTLVLITPYPRLQPGLLTSLLPGLHQLLHLIESQNRMVDLRAGCLNLLGCILGRVPGPLMEVCQILSDDVSSTELNDPWTVIPHLRNTLSTYRTSCDHLAWSGQSRDGPRGPGCWFSLQSQDPFQPCWLVQVCLRLIHPDVSTFAWDAATQPAYPEVANFGGTVDQFTVGTGCQSTKQCQPPPVRVQALTVLRNMVPNYAAFLRPSLPLLKKTLLFCLQDYKKNKLLWAPTLKFLLVFLPYLQIVPTATNDPSTDTISQGESLAWWCDFIPPIVGILRNSKLMSERSYCCKVLALLDTKTVEAIQKQEQFAGLIGSVIEVMQSIVEDGDDVLRARCIRTLGSLVTLRPLQTNLSLLCYIIDRAPAIWNRAVNQSIELDVAWSLASCLEVVVAHRVGLIPDSPKWSSVLHELSGAGVSWTKLVQTCCELCTVCTTETCSLGSEAQSQIGGSGFCESKNPSTDEQSNPVRPTLKPVAERSVSVKLNTEASKTPDAHRCENGARALGYLLRILEPGLIREQNVISQLFESICEAMITNKASSAEKIRWNANFAVGHLFQNTNLWLWLSDQWNRDVQTEPRDFAAVDPLASVETVQLIKKLIRYLCQTFGGDKYFKTRVYAANSLLGLFVHKQQALTGSPLHIMRQSLTRIASEPIDCCLEFNVLDAAFRIIGQVHNGNASVPCCAEYLQRTISHVNFHSSGTHLSERKYRQQCLHMAILLIFYSLASWLHTADRDSLDCLENSLTNEWICPIVLSHIAGSLRDCAASRDCPDLAECKLETIYPRPMILSHLLDLTDTTSPTERLTQAVQLFQSRVASLPCAIGPGMQHLVTLVQTVEVMPKETMLCVGTTWCSLNELQKPTTPETILSDVSRFRQVYD